MARIPQARATKGSQHWLQHLVETNPAKLNSAVGLGSLEWLSPMAGDQFAEYQDAAFVERLGVQLNKRPLDSFWPAGGPVWDGLARTALGTCVLVEAKARIPEMTSSCAAAERTSIETIKAALGETQRAFDVEPGYDWCEGHYQYANRLAHAFLLNELNGVPTELVFVYFIGDQDIGGPQSRNEWVKAVTEAHDRLGVLGQLPRYVHDVFVDLGDL